MNVRGYRLARHAGGEFGKRGRGLHARDRLGPSSALTRKSSVLLRVWRPIGGMAAQVALAVLSLTVLIVASCSNAIESTAAPTNSSPSYRQGYDTMMSHTRQVVAGLASRGIHESMSQVVGSSQDAASLCDNTLQAMVSGAALGTGSQLPSDFRSADFLRGCTDAGKAILESGK